MKLLVFDTETQKGNAFIACTFDGKNENTFFISNQSDVIQFFVYLHTQTKIGFCYNLEYDISSLIKYFGQKTLIDFYVEKPITFKYEGSQYELSGFIKKFIKISKLKTISGEKEKTSRESTFFYDICQYYEYQSLDKASEKYLKEKKDDIPKEWKKNMLKYFKSHKNKIIEYCKKDTRLTYRLVEHFFGMLIAAGIISKKQIGKLRYYSYGYIAKKFIGKKAKIFPLNDEIVNNFLQNFYFGGRIELMQRGYFPKVYLYDINSAYGSGLANLKNITGYQFAQRVDESADYFFVDCNFQIPENYILPVPKKFKNWKYPFGTGRAILDKRTFYNTMSCGKILHVRKCLNIYAEEHYPFREIVHKLYTQRLKSESHKIIFKNLINSYIGKLNEKAKQKTFIPDDKQDFMMNMLSDWNQATLFFENEIRHCNCGCYEREKIRETCRCPVCLEYKKKYEKIKEPPKFYHLGNKMFYSVEKLKQKTHPIYNALVVSGMRNSLYEQGLSLDNNIIGFFTDAIFTTSPIAHTSNKLGEFAEKYKGWLYIIGGGVYETAQGTKIRGYHQNLSLVDYAQKNKNKDEFAIPSLIRMGIGRAVGDIASFHKFNELTETPRIMNVNFDTNRIWEKQFQNFGESLKKNITSVPIKI